MASELMTLEPRQHIPEKKADPRASIVDALMKLAALQPFEDITIRDICANAGVSLADFRDAFPSKGAVLAGFSRRVDRLVLEGGGDELIGEPAKERLFDILMRRLDAMAPWRAGIGSVLQWARREPLEAAALNRLAVNSMRFMLESAGIEAQGSVGAMKLQGLVVAWTRVLDVWVHDADPGFAATMAALDRELTRGTIIISRLDDMHRITSPLRAMFRAALELPGRFGERLRNRPGEANAPTGATHENRTTAD